MIVKKENFTLVNNIREYRTMYDLSQEDLSFITGISQNTISDLENGKNCPSLVNAFRICRVFDCNLEDLFTFIDERFNKGGV